MKLAFWKKTPEDTPAPKKVKSAGREWLDAIVFAAVAAIVIRGFIAEAFMIPTCSMERTLMVGDFVVVSKFHYGARLPMAPLALPLMHNKLPGTHTPSFLDWIELPYLRLPGVVDVQRNDIFVFNYPVDDIMPNDPELGPVTIPSLKENYIKRCVAIPGDVLSIRQGTLYINGKPSEVPEHLQQPYRVRVKSSGYSQDFSMKRLEEYGFRDPRSPNHNWRRVHPDIYQFDLTEALVPVFEGWSNVRSVERDTLPASMPMRQLFPYNIHRFPWNLDNYGPITIPKEGMTVKLDSTNRVLYRRAIEVYEGNSWEEKGGQVLINGEPATSYTFKMDYYWAMGDNRHNSQDSRYWGFVPEDHIVGKPLMVLFSFENGFRASRFFKGIN